MIRRLKLKTCLNTRDIGGYEVSSGIMTRYKKYLRSDDISACSQEEIEYLKNFGVKTVIDLRGEKEVKEIPNAFSNQDSIEYYNISIIPDNYETSPLKELYINIINNFGAMKELFSVIAAKTDGTILYHCTAGKDRTGITTALLLMLVGVDRNDIIADYQVSYTYLFPKLKALFETFPDIPQHLLKSDPEIMADTYDYIIKTFGSAYNYLVQLGIKEEEIELIKGGLLCTSC